MSTGQTKIMGIINLNEDSFYAPSRVSTVDAFRRRADALLDAILAVLPLDQYDANNFVLMAKPDSDPADVSIWETYKATLHKYEPDAVVSYEERFAFYERARKAYAVVATGEEKQYANIILKKGCVL